MSAPDLTIQPGFELAPWRERIRSVGPGVGLAWLVLGLILIAALWPGLLTSQSPDAVNPANALAGPSLHHLCGTDQLGRDVFSRIIYGAGPSLTIGFGATALALGAGSLLGVLAASAGRVFDELIMRVTDVFLAFPGLLLALLVVAVLGPGTTTATLAIGCAMLPGFVRLARAQALTVRNSDYVQAAVVLGRSRRSIYARHLLPNALPPLLVFATVNVGAAIIAGSALSFLGLGPAAPSPEWGAMLAEGQDFLTVAWAMAVFPGVAVTVTVIAVNVVGRDLRRRFQGRR